MRRILFVVLLLITVSGYTQDLKPVKWTWTSKAIGQNTYDLIFTAKINPGWTIYSTFMEPGGPVPTSFEFEKGDHFELEGPIKEEGEKKKLFDKYFEQEVIKLFKQVTYTQRVKLLKAGPAVGGYFTFMTCDEERCLPPADTDFSFKLDFNANGGDKKEPEGGKTDIGLTTPSSAPAKSQQLLPVSWQSAWNKVSETDYEVMLTAVVDPAWNIYSKDMAEGGPIPTTIEWEGSGWQLLGGLMEEADQVIKGKDPLFDNMEVIKLKGQIRYKQMFKVENPQNATLKAIISYMTCDSEKCIADDEEINLAFHSGVTASADPTFNGPVIDNTRPTLQTSYEAPLGQCEEKKRQSSSLLWTFVLGFLGGLLALLTPCVFPMIPLTVSFFTKGSKDRATGMRNGWLFGLSIIVIYVSIGLLITALAGPKALNAMSTNWLFNTLFFVIFVVFALSFFGLFEITLPSSWTTKTDSLSEQGGLLGIFFMAFTLSLVSFSCTGPIIGTALVESVTTGKLGPFIVMLGFSSALALPFGLFAAFPAWLNSLPRSGSWMSSVKVVLGFLELALAFKFLSVADMTSHWGFLRYELFMVIWIILFGLTTLYLFGIIRFPHDGPKGKLSLLRLGFAGLFLVFTAYLVTGLGPNERTRTYNPLSLLSGLAPPANYNFFKPLPEPDQSIKARFASFSKCANNLDCFKDYEEGLAYAKEVGKPILLDFTGYGCVNCRKTEEHIWTNDAVWSKIANDYVLISLYTDDDQKLDTPLLSKITGEKIRKVGGYWKDFQTVNFKQISQPLYVLVSPNEQVLVPAREYKEGVNGYLKFLDCGLETFQNIHKEQNLMGNLQ